MYREMNKMKQGFSSSKNVPLSKNLSAYTTHYFSCVMEEIFAYLKGIYELDPDSDLMVT